MNMPSERPVRSPEIPQSPEAAPADEPRPEDQGLPTNPEPTENEADVEEASEDSFPASDPPSFTRSSTTRNPG